MINLFRRKRYTKGKTSKGDDRRKVGPAEGTTSSAATRAGQAAGRTTAAGERTAAAGRAELEARTAEGNLAAHAAPEPVDTRQPAPETTPPESPP